MAILLLATLYAVTIPFRGGLSLFDTAIFVALFAAYVWAAARAPSHEPELVGPARLVGNLPTGRRRFWMIVQFLYAAIVIFLSAEPFAEGLVQSGLRFGIDEFVLVQWLAPLASESPEFLVAILFAWRGNAAAGMRAIVSSTANQWTLLVGTLALVYSIAAGRPSTLPLDGRQSMEIFLTGTQSLFAIILVVALVLDWKAALVLFALFLAQLVAPWEGAHLWFAIAYVVVAISLVVCDGTRRSRLLRLPAEAWLTLRGGPAVEAPAGAPSAG